MINILGTLIVKSTMQQETWKKRWKSNFFLKYGFRKRERFRRKWTPNKNFDGWVIVIFVGGHEKDFNVDHKFG